VAVTLIDEKGPQFCLQGMDGCWIDIWSWLTEVWTPLSFVAIAPLTSSFIASISSFVASEERRVACGANNPDQDGHQEKTTTPP